MSGLLTLLRASLLGACLCIAAMQLPHTQAVPSGFVQSGSDSQLPGDLGSIAADANDADDVDDVLSRVEPELFCLDFGADPHRRGARTDREHLRIEDRRCDKPPRA